MSGTHKQVVKVWIAPGCIVCDACETECPEVFDVQEETCVIRPAAKAADFVRALTPSVIAAAESCPVEVIKFETVDVEGPEPWTGKPAGETEPVARGAGGHTAGSKAKPVPAIPVGPPDPKWAGLLSTTRAAGSRTAGGAGVVMRPARAPAEAVASALPKGAPPDALAAAMVGSGFARPRPSVVERIRSKASISRREFGAVTGVSALVLVAWAAIAATGATFLAAFQSFLVPKVSKEPPTTFRAGRVADFPAPGVYEQFKGSQGVWMVRLPSDQLVALSTTCTHLGCIPNWLQADQKFKCPCHGSGFYVTGVNFEGPAPRPLERYKISLDGEFIVVDKSIKYRQELGDWTKPGSFLTV